MQVTRLHQPITANKRPYFVGYRWVLGEGQEVEGTEDKYLRTLVQKSCYIQKSEPTLCRLYYEPVDFQRTYYPH
jgi:hypothetical protein